MRLRNYRILVVIFGAGTIAGIREYVISRRGQVIGAAAACEASAASCFSIRSTALASRDPEFWQRHARMVRVVAELNPHDPDTDFLEGMEALAAGDENEFVRRFEKAIASGAKHNHLLLQYWAQYLLDSGADWEKVNIALNRWRENDQFSNETISLGISAIPRTGADEAALRRALATVSWIAEAEIEHADSTQQPRLRMWFRPGRSVDMREAVAAVTILSIPPDQRGTYRITCRTLVDCTANRRIGR